MLNFKKLEKQEEIKTKVSKGKKPIKTGYRDKQILILVTLLFTDSVRHRVKFLILDLLPEVGSEAWDSLSL